MLPDPCQECGNLDAIDIVDRCKIHLDPNDKQLLCIDCRHRRYVDACADAGIDVDSGPGSFMICSKCKKFVCPKHYIHCEYGGVWPINCPDCHINCVGNCFSLYYESTTK